MLLLSSCGGGERKNDAASTERFGKPSQISQSTVSPAPAPVAVAPVSPMQPPQPGQPPQKPERSVSTVPAVAGGSPGTNPLPFNQPFRLADKEYQFMAARGKDFVGLETRPAMRPNPGNSYFLVRYQVISHSPGMIAVPNVLAVHLINRSTNQVTDVDAAATNANVVSGAATGMPDVLELESERPQIQTLAFQVPSKINANEMAILVTEPKAPAKVFQLVQMAN